MKSALVSGPTPDPVCGLFRQWQAQETVARAAAEPDPSEAELDKLYAIEAAIARTPAVGPRGLLAKLEWIERELRTHVSQEGADDLERMIFSAIDDAKRLLV